MEELCGSCAGRVRPGGARGNEIKSRFSMVSYGTFLTHGGQRLAASLRLVLNIVLQIETAAVTTGKESPCQSNAGRGKFGLRQNPHIKAFLKSLIICW